MRQRDDRDPFFVSSSQKFKDYLVKSKTKGKWFEVDSFSNNKDKTNNESLGLWLNPKIITGWLVIIFLGILILAGKAAWLQLVKGSYFKVVAEGNRLRIHDIKSSRGVMYDRQRNLLVENVPSFSLAIIPVDLPKKELLNQVATELANISQKPAAEILKFINEQSPYSYQPLIIAENLSYDQAILVQILRSHFPGVVLQIDSTRHYLETAQQPSLSHLLGYQGKISETERDQYLAKGYLLNDYIGKAGLELSYEKELRGVYGKEQVEVDARGEAKEIIAFQKPVPGKNLVLTIDSDLQKQAELSLRQTLASYGKSRGAVVVLDPNSGEVLALVSWPAFDNNLFSQGISLDKFSKLISDPNQPMFPRAISGEYPSGSTFKLIVGAAALQEGLITKNTSFNSVGGIWVDRWFFPDWRATGHGWTSISRAIAESINTFFYIIGGGYKDFSGLGIEKMKEYAQKFGLNKKLGIDLPNEARGFFPSIEWKEKTKNELWYIGDTYHIAIGQGDILVTPLQVAAWTAVFASGGTLYQPHLVKEILDRENNVVREIKPKILNKDFVSPENIKIINQGLRQAVTAGSAQALYNLPVAVAAKTGTAQWSTKYQPHAWITAFAPYNNPQIVVTVLVEEGGEGSRVALPVAYDIISWWAQNR